MATVNYNSIKEVNGESIDSSLIPDTITMVEQHVSQMIKDDVGFKFLNDANLKPRIEINSEGVATVHCTVPKASAAKH